MTEEDYTEEPKPAKKSFGWLGWFLVAVTVWSLVGPFIPHRGHKGSDFTDAISNLNQIGRALLDFESGYGSYPSEKTSKAVTDQFPDHGFNLSGKSSNALFRQLFAAEFVQSEQAFYAKISGTRKSDGNTTPGRLLEKGEVAFAYIPGLSPEGNPARPIAFAPVIPGTTRFDPKPFDGTAIILRTDQAVTSLKIGKDGHVRAGGFDILSPQYPAWNGEVIDIRYPE